MIDFGYTYCRCGCGETLTADEADDYLGYTARCYANYIKNDRLDMLARNLMTACALEVAFIAGAMHERASERSADGWECGCGTPLKNWPCK